MALIVKYNFETNQQIKKGGLLLFTSPLLMEKHYLHSILMVALISQVDYTCAM